MTFFIIDVLFILLKLCIIGGVFIFGLCLVLFVRDARPLGTVIMLLPAAYLAFFYLEPEWAALFSRPVETTISDRALVVPKVLVLHGRFGVRVGDRQDGLALAETGLFRVVFAAPEPDAPIQGEAVVAEAADCADIRSDPGHQLFNIPPKIGGLLFTARTGFERCAKYWPGSMVLPQSRLDLWTEPPPGEPTPHGSLRGVMLLTVVEDGKRRVVARRESHARPVPTRWSWLNGYHYDARPEYSELTSDSYDDPDPVDFVLAALHTTEDVLPKEGALSDADLSRRAAAAVASVSTSKGKRRAALALAGATRGDAAESEATIAPVAWTILNNADISLSVRVPSDCTVALHAAAGRQALAPSCEAQRQSGPQQICEMPFEPVPFLERCTEIRKTIWEKKIQGRTTLVLGAFGAPRSPLGIGDGYAAIRPVHVRREDGLLNLVLVAPGPSLWSLDGSIGCLDRVTVVGRHVGVIGIEPERVQFRDRAGASELTGEDGAIGKTLSGLLGRRPERIVVTPGGRDTVIGEQRLGGVGCRSAVETPPVATPTPDQVVSGPLDVVFRLAPVRSTAGPGGKPALLQEGFSGPTQD